MELNEGDPSKTDPNGVHHQSFKKVERLDPSDRNRTCHSKYFGTGDLETTRVVGGRGGRVGEGLHPGFEGSGWRFAEADFSEKMSPDTGNP